MARISRAHKENERRKTMSRSSLLKHKRFIFVVLILLIAAVLAYPTLRREVRSYTIEKRIDRYQTIIQQQAEQTGLEVALIRAIIAAESSGRPHVESKKNAKGLMQITPIAEIDVLKHHSMVQGDLFSPDYNILIGTLYLQDLYNRFDHDLTLTVAAYHMGPTHVSRLRKEYPQLTSQQLIEQHANPTTRRYVLKVLKSLRS